MNMNMNLALSFILLFYCSLPFISYSQVVIRDTLIVSPLDEKNHQQYGTTEDDPWVCGFYVYVVPESTTSHRSYSEWHSRVYAEAFDEDGVIFNFSSIDMYKVDVSVDEVGAFYGEPHLDISGGGIPCKIAPNGIRAENQMLLEGNSLTEIPIKYLNPYQDEGHVVFKKNSKFPFLDSDTATIIVNVAGFPGRRGEAKLTILGNYFYINHFYTDFEQDPVISHTEERIVRIYAVTKDDEIVYFPADSLLYIVMDDSAKKYGSLIGVDSLRNKELYDVPYQDIHLGKIRYIADGENPEKDVPISISIYVKNHPSRNGTVQGIVTSGLDHFEVTIQPDTIVHSDTATVYVKAMSKANQEVNLTTDSQINLSLDSVGELHGNLFDTLNSTIAKSLTNVLYRDAKIGRARYIANGLNPINCDPKTIEVNVRLSEKPQNNGDGSLVVKCKTELPSRYAQCGEAWSADSYDKLADKTICGKGCALCSQAMLMTAFGDTITPDSLNNWMLEKITTSDGTLRYKFVNEGGFGDNGKVSWLTPIIHSGGKIFFNPDIDYHKVNMWKAVKDPNGDTIQHELQTQNKTQYSLLDDPLKKCKLVIVEVYNSNSGNSHWVLVTHIENSRYIINDPGPRGEKYLTDYDGFWTWVVYSKNNQD